MVLLKLSFYQFPHRLGPKYQLVPGLGEVNGVRVRVIKGDDIKFNMSIAVRIKLQTVVWKFSPTFEV